MLPSRVAGGIPQSSSSSGISFQGDGNSQVAGNSQLSSNFGSSPNTLTGHAQGSICQDRVLNSMASSGPSVGASSLVTDANSGLSGGPHLQRTASNNTESYMRLPASPLSFSSNNISMSSSSVMDVSSVIQQNSYQDPVTQPHPNQQPFVNTGATSLMNMGQVQLPAGRRLSNSYLQEATTFSQLQKKPHLDIKHEDILQQQVLQQLTSRQDPSNLQGTNPQFQALIQQHRLRQQEQQIFQAMTPFQRAQLLQQQQQLQLRQQLQLHGMPQPSATALKRPYPYEGGVCSRRLMQYLYHEGQRPANSIEYWRNFVAEYYSPRAKKRWCLSLYNSVGHHSLGAFPQASVDAWQCDICGTKSGRGFEATFEVLPRLNEIKFASGILDEFLFLDLPRESRFPSGVMMLEYAKARQESVYEQLRVVHEGHLRIIFTPDLKILSWEFCARFHEELLPRRLIAPQVNQLLQVAQKCQSALSEGGAENAQQNLQGNSSLVISAGRQLARSLELQSLNDLGFSKRYVRCLQIADVVNSMKGLMDFCKEQKKGPIEGLKNFPRCVGGPAIQLQKSQETDQNCGHQGQPTDPNQVREQMALHPDLCSRMNINQHAGIRGALSGAAQAAFALNNYQNTLIRQNSLNLANNSTQREVFSPFGENTGPSSFLLQKSQISGFPTSQPPQNLQQFQQMHSPSASNLQQQNASMSSQALQQHMIEQMLQNMTKKNSNMGMGTIPQENISLQNPTGDASSSGRGFVGSSATAGGDQPLNKSYGFEPNSSNSQSPAPPSGLGQKATDLSQNFHSLSEFIPDISDEFNENIFFNSDLDDNMSFSWKD